MKPKLFLSEITLKNPKTALEVESGTKRISLNCNVILQGSGNFDKYITNGKIQKTALMIDILMGAIKIKTE